MPTVKLTATEAKRVKAARARNKSHNATVGLCVDRVKARLKKADPLESATLQAVLQDMRKLIR